MSLSRREDLVDTAMQLFYRNGFHAVGLDRIIAETGVTKTTFYNHFESKDDLVVAVIRKRDQWWRQTFTQAIRAKGGTDPRSQLLAAFDVLHEWFNEEPFCGCMFINAAAEFPNPYDPAHEAAADNKRAIEEMVRGLAQEAQASDAAGFAEQFTLIMEGAIVTRQVTRSDRAAAIARRTAQLLIDAHLPPRAPTADPHLRRQRHTRPSRSSN